MSYNILVGGRGRVNSIIRVLQELSPDVVVLQEAIDPVVVEQIAAALDMPVWYARQKQSLAVLSRMPIAHCEWRSYHPKKRPILEVRLEQPALTIFGVHFQAYFFRSSEQGRLQEAQALVEMAAVSGANAHVLVGDFNTIAPGEVVEHRRMPLRVSLLLRAVGGYFQSDALRAVLGAGYVDAFRALNPSERGCTFPAQTPQIRLDYLFVPPTMVEQVRECHVVTNGVVPRASDHCPLLAVLDV